jgi:SOS-response transcriptional repressor LexA
MPIPIGRIIAGLRKTKNIRQVDMASKTGMKQSSLSRLECGVYEPMRSTLERICTVLGCSLAELYSDKIIEGIAPEHRKRIEGGAVEKHEVRFTLIDFPKDTSIEFGPTGKPLIDGIQYIQIPADIQKLKKGFAIRIRDDSMEADYPSQSFAEGDIVIVDETKIAQGDFVFVHLRDRRSLIRQAYKDGHEGWRLIPLNPKYQEKGVKDSDVVVMRKVVAHLKYLIPKYDLGKPGRKSG